MSSFSSESRLFGSYLRKRGHIVDNSQVTYFHHHHPSFFPQPHITYCAVIWGSGPFCVLMILSSPLLPTKPHWTEARISSPALPMQGLPFCKKYRDEATLLGKKGLQRDWRADGCTWLIFLDYYKLCLSMHLGKSGESMARWGSAKGHRKKYHISPVWNGSEQMRSPSPSFLQTVLSFFFLPHSFPISPPPHSYQTLGDITAFLQASSMVRKR